MIKLTRISALVIVRLSLLAFNSQFTGACRLSLHWCFTNDYTQVYNQKKIGNRKNNEADKGGHRFLCIFYLNHFVQKNWYLLLIIWREQKAIIRNTKYLLFKAILSQSFCYFLLIWPEQKAMKLPNPNRKREKKRKCLPYWLLRKN